MTQASTETAREVLHIRIMQQVFPARHETHGTPYPVVQRVFAFNFPQGTAEVDQTDYGHPGRFNPCHVRHVPPALQPKTSQIVAAAQALAALLG